MVEKFIQTPTSLEATDKINQLTDSVNRHSLETTLHTTAEEKAATAAAIQANTGEIASVRTIAQGKADSSHTHDDRYYTESEVDSKLAAKASAATYTVTLTVADWSGAAPYTQTVSVPGILATDKPIYSIVYSGTLENKLSQKDAFSLINDLDTFANAVTFTCFEDKPVTNITVQMEVVR